jgi:hypothetical protein
MSTTYDVKGYIDIRLKIDKTIDCSQSSTPEDIVKLVDCLEELTNFERHKNWEGFNQKLLELSNGLKNVNKIISDWMQEQAPTEDFNN